jgi:glycosyl transferase family 25
MLSELEKTGVPFELVQAVDCNELKLDDDRIVNPLQSERACSDGWNRKWSMPGVAACAISHMLALRQILEQGHETAIVMEDDVQLPPDLDSLAGAVSEQLVGAEVALLNFDSRYSCRLSTDGAVTVSSSRQLVYPVDAYELCSAAAYLITRQACERMWQSWVPLRACPDDWGFYRDHGVFDRIRCVTPMPVSKNPAFASTIEYNAVGGMKAHLRSAVLRRQVPVLSRIIVFRRRQIFRRWTRTEFVEGPTTTTDELTP